MERKTATAALQPLVAGSSIFRPRHLDSPQITVYKYSMLVDVVELRRDGVRVPRDRITSVRPIRGHLWLTNFRPAADNSTTPLMAALLLNEKSLLPPLDWAEVRSIRDGQLLVVGFQDTGLNPRNPKPMRQSWWCRLVTADSVAPAAFDAELGLSDQHRLDQKPRRTGTG